MATSRTGGGGDQGLGNSRRHRAESGCALGAQAMEGIHDAHHGAEKADKWRDPPIVASHVRRRSKTVSDSLAAAWAARSRYVTMFFGGPKPPVWRRYVSYTSSNTLTSGLGLNCSLTAAISCSRLALRKARTKAPALRYGHGERR